MRRIMVLLIFLAVFFMPASAGARNEVHLSSVSVDVWPEYDQSAVLVIYHITLDPGTVLPATFILHVPAQAEISAVAIEDQNGSLLNAPYDRAIQGQWAELTITANSLQVQVEYYDALMKSDSVRHIVFEWNGDYQVSGLDINFLEPVGAIDVKLNPGPHDSSVGQSGLINDHVITGPLTAGQHFILKVDYKRLTDSLSIVSSPVQPVTTPGANTPGRISVSGILPWVLLGIGVLLLIGGMIGFTVWRRGGSRNSVIKKQHQPRRKENEDEDELVYCQQCGKRSQPGDVYCRTCGTRLRHDSAD
jgi:hypothetical protein